MSILGKALRSTIFLGALGAIIISTLAFTATVREDFSDPRLGLLVSQAIIEQHTVRLDAYVPLYKTLYENRHHGIYKRNGHVYDLYPLGTPIFSIPVVYAYLKAGLVMYDDQHIMLAQSTLKAIILPVIFLILFSIGRMYVTPLDSFVITMVTFLGSPLMSSMGIGLWSHDFGVLCASLVMLVLVRHDTRRARLNPYLLGFLLFCAYLCRPTFSLLILSTFIYLFLEDKKLLFKVALTSFIFLLGLVAFSLNEYGLYLPPYYSGEVWLGFTENWFETVYGMLLSPSRGLLIFSPFLIVVIAAAIMSKNQVLGGRLAFLMTSWFLAQFFLLSLEGRWWAGANFGLRRMVDPFAIVALISFMLFRWARSAEMRKTVFHTLIWTYIVLGVFATWVNTRQALYNRWTKQNPTKMEEVFDWRYAQFMMSGQKLKEFLEEQNPEAVKDYDLIFDEERQELLIAPKGTAPTRQ